MEDEEKEIDFDPIPGRDCLTPEVPYLYFCFYFQQDPNLRSQGSLLVRITL